MKGARRAVWLGAGSAVAVLLIWTSFILIARLSAKGHLNPFDIAFLRFAFSGVIVLPIVVGQGGRLLARLGANTRQALWRGGVLAATAGVAYCSLAYSGFFFAPVAHAAVLLPGSLPLYTAIFAVLLAGERFGPARLAGLAAIVAGDLLIGATSLLEAFGRHDTSWKGDLLFLGAAMTWGLYSVLCRRWRLDALPATCAIAIGCLVSYVPLFALGAAFGLVPTRLPSAPWSEILFQAVYQGGLAMFVAGVAFTYAVKTFGPVSTTMVTALVPVLATLLAAPLLGEPITATAAVGLACVTAGLLIGVRAQSVQRLAAPPPDRDGGSR